MSLRLLYPRTQAAAEITGAVSVEFGFETDAIGSVQEQEQAQTPTSGGGGGGFSVGVRRRRKPPIVGSVSVGFAVSQTHAIGEVLPGDELWVLGLDEEFAA